VRRRYVWLVYVTCLYLSIYLSNIDFRAYAVGEGRGIIAGDFQVRSGRRPGLGTLLDPKLAILNFINGQIDGMPTSPLSKSSRT
jgi:hypothetical protein